MNKQKERHTIATASRIFIIIPSSTNAATLLKYNEVVTVIALDQINSHTHACKVSAVL
jgi:hypothetical protein